MEQFKEFCPGCEISNEGRVRIHGSIRELSVNKEGYKNLTVVIGLHRAVAFLFKDHPDRRTRSLLIDHIDRNPLNNHVDNLRWVTRTENYENSDHHEMKQVCGDVAEVTRLAEAAKARAVELANAIETRRKLRIAKRELAEVAKRERQMKRHACTAAKLAAAAARTEARKLANPPMTPYLLTFRSGRLRIAVSTGGKKIRIGATTNPAVAERMLEAAKRIRAGGFPGDRDEKIRTVELRMYSLMQKNGALLLL